MFAGSEIQCNVATGRKYFVDPCMATPTLASRRALITANIAEEPMYLHRLAIALIAVSIGACARARSGSDAAGTATAAIRNANGTQLGVLRLESAGGGVRLTGQLTGLAPGAHGLHVHAVGRCDAPAFTSAGGHFNPRNTKHGLVNPEGPHAGDMPAIAADDNGRAVVQHTTPLISLGSGANGLFDTDGSAIVVHASSDDQRTDPSGDSGARIACGVVERS